MTLDAVRSKLRAALPDRAWSQGVRLARAGRVRADGEDEDELRFSVRIAGRPSLEVCLWPAEEDWGCDCGLEACAHAAAAVIAVSTGALAADDGPRLRYRLELEGGRLVPRIELRRAGGVEPLDRPLREIPGLVLREEDLELERLLGRGAQLVPAAAWRSALQRWRSARSELLLEGRPVRPDPTPIRPVLLVSDDGPGYRLTLHRPAEVDRTLPGGLVLCGDTLRPMGDGGLDPQQRRALVRGLHLGPRDAAELAGEILPRLRRGLRVELRSSRLPEHVERLPLRASLSIRELPGGLELLAELVYGDPPAARLRGDDLELLGAVVPLRDRRAEREAGRRLDAELGIPQGRPWRLEGHEAALFVRDRLPRFRGAVRGGPGRFRVRTRPVAVELVEGDGALGLRLRSEADPVLLHAAFREGRSLVPLREGGWAPMPADLLERHSALLADLAEACGPGGEVPRHAAPLARELLEALDRPCPGALEKLRPLLEGFDGIPDAPPPEGISATLRPYQHEGYRWLRFLASAGLGGLLADDMGLGKTIQALCMLAVTGGPSLVIAPRSVLRNWALEAERFFPGRRVAVFHGPGRRFEPEAWITVSSYALLRLDPVLSEPHWKAVVLDEAQAIKNPSSQTARAAFALHAEHRLALTGTPLENRLDELWSILRFASPGLLGGRRGFRERVASRVEAGDREATAALRRRIAPFLLRRTKEQVAPELPPRTEIVLRCELPRAHREVYEAVRAAARPELLRAAGAGRSLEVLEHLLRLRQAACHPALLPGRHEEPSGKIEVLMERLDELAAGGHRALVFSQWTRMLDLVEGALRERSLRNLRLDGSTRNRQRVVGAFQDPGGPPVMLISLKAGGTGLNLTAADYVFHLDPWWNPAVEAQATDRAHRIGQQRPVFSLKLIAADTVEERVLELQRARRSLARAVTAGDAAMVRSLGREELEAILG